jgi:hypothetical protein
MIKELEDDEAPPVRAHPTSTAFPQRVTSAWLTANVPTMALTTLDDLVALLESRDWSNDEIDERVLSLRCKPPEPPR